MTVSLQLLELSIRFEPKFHTYWAGIDSGCFRTRTRMSSQSKPLKHSRAMYDPEQSVTVRTNFIDGLAVGGGALLDVPHGSPEGSVATTRRQPDNKQARGQSGKARDPLWHVSFQKKNRTHPLLGTPATMYGAS